MGRPQTCSRGSLSVDDASREEAQVVVGEGRQPNRGHADLREVHMLRQHDITVTLTVLAPTGRSHSIRTVALSHTQLHRRPPAMGVCDWSGQEEE